MKIKLIDYGLKEWPKRAHYNDAGLDVYSCQNIMLEKHETIKIPLGFGIELPDGYVGYIFPRSGLSSKGIACELAPIDSGYRGEIHAIVTNHNDHEYYIHEGDRVGQLVILPCIMAELVPCFENKTREKNAFGSTGK